MSRLSRLLFAILALTSFSLAGCGGAGAPTPVAQAPASNQKPAKLTAPTTRIDPSKADSVVANEVNGGEREAGPTPIDFLYQMPNTALIHDEPYTIAVPLGLETVESVIPASNPMTKGKVELGKQLYFDPRISKDATVSCASCHHPDKGWTDNLMTSVGIAGQVGGRNAPTVLNTVYGKSMFWDGRAPSLEGQAQGPIQNKIEMGDQSYRQIVSRLRTIPGYKAQFAKVFGTDVTLDGMAKAIAAFERTALSGNSAYDKYSQADPDKPETFAVLSQSEKTGMVLFGLRLNSEDSFKVDSALLGKANCTACHAGSNFSDEMFHNIGVGYDAAKKEFADLGRFEIAPIGAKSTAELGSFKTPTVRDITRTAPYMHDGTEKTLEQVVEYYNKGGNANLSLDPKMKPLNLTETEKANLVAFMKALTSPKVVIALPTLPPGPDGKTVDPTAALGMGPGKVAVDLKAIHGISIR